MFYSGTKFTSFDDHPGQFNCTGHGKKKRCSTASGNYMILQSVWTEVAKRLDLKDFSPFNQDIAALYLLNEKGALEDIERGDIKLAMKKAGDIWATIPGSRFGESTKTEESLIKFYKKRYAHYSRYMNSSGGWLW